MTDQTTPKTDHRKDSLPNYKWLQLPVDYLDDPDFNQLSDAAGFLFIRLYLIALKADAEGIVGNGRKMYTSKDLAFTFRKSEPDTAKHLQELEAAGFIEIKPNIRVCRFLDEQGPGSEEQRKQWRERQRKHRAKLNGEGESEETENDQEGNPTPDLLRSRSGVSQDQVRVNTGNAGASETQNSQTNIKGIVEVEVADINLKGPRDVTVTSLATAAAASSSCSSCGKSLTAYTDEDAVKAIVTAVKVKVGPLEDETFAYRLAEKVCNWYEFKSGCECDIRRMELMALDELRCKDCDGWKTIANEEAYLAIYNAIEKIFPDGDPDLIQEVASDHAGNYEWWCPTCDLAEWVKRGLWAYNALWEGEQRGEHPLAAFPDDYDRIVSYLGPNSMSGEELEKTLAEREAKAADPAGRDMSLAEWRKLQAAEMAEKTNC